MENHISDDERTLLAQRAGELAARTRDGERQDGEEPATPVLLLSIGGERFAVATKYVAETFVAEAPVPVPCTPGHMAGVVMRRGRLVAAVDLARKLSLSTVKPGCRPGGDDRCTYLVLSAEGRELAAIVESVSSVVEMNFDALNTSHSAAADAEYAIGFGPGLVTVLDGLAILRDPALHVNETVSE